MNFIVCVMSEVGVILNDGNICVKGCFGFDFVGKDDWFIMFFVRKDGELELVSWDEMFDFVVKRFFEIKKEYGLDVLVALSLVKMINEDNYIM